MDGCEAAFMPYWAAGGQGSQPRITTGMCVGSARAVAPADVGQQYSPWAMAVNIPPLPHGALLAGADFGVFSGPAPLPSATLKLSLDARGDRCEERVFQELRFDLTPVRQHFQRTFGIESGTMVLRLSTGRVLYSF